MFNNEDVKVCSTSFFIMNTNKNSYQPINTTKIENTKPWWSWNLLISLKGVKWHSQCGKLAIPTETKYAPIPTFSNSTPGYIYPREMNAYVHIKTCTEMFIATLPIIVKKQKQPKSTRGWIKNRGLFTQLNIITGI